MDFFDKSKAIICFLRHGQTDWNLEFKMQGREEIPLNETGIAQAHEAARGLKYAKDIAGISWTKIVSSPLSRAQDTAKIISDAVECDNLYVDERIIERDFGELSGLVYEEFSRATFNNVPEIKTVETIEALMERTNEFIKDNVSVGERVLIVTHGAITRIFARNAKRSPKIPKDFEHSIKNCHLVVYSYDGEDTVLEAYNIAPGELYRLTLDEEIK
ncbi:MAG: histidine phosphatase family protein [Clostridia bacterium]|nr:histidine phosphatase family protein [Clostridia bacterium]